MSVEGGLTGLSSSSQAGLTVMTQPLSNASSASAVTSRRVGSSGSSGKCCDSFKTGLLVCDEMSEAIWQDKCPSIVTKSLVNGARAISDELRVRCVMTCEVIFRSEFELLRSGH